MNKVNINGKEFPIPEPVAKEVIKAVDAHDEEIIKAVDAHDEEIIKATKFVDDALEKELNKES